MTRAQRWVLVAASVGLSCIAVGIVLAVADETSRQS